MVKSATAAVHWNRSLWMAPTGLGKGGKRKKREGGKRRVGKESETQHVRVSSAKVETSSLVFLLVLPDFCQGLHEDVWMTASECVACWLVGCVGGTCACV